MAAPVPAPTLDISPDRLSALESIRLRLRQKQRVLADWRGGPLAVSAVPGAGKSTGMAGGAAIAVAAHRLHRGKQLVVVTFTRSAAAQIRDKIRQHLQSLKLPMGGFSVYTIHGLSLAIAHQHPDLSGIDEDLAVLSEAEKKRYLRQAVDRWVEHSPQQFQELLEGGGFDGEESERQRRITVLRSEVLPDLARTLIPEAKSSDSSPDKLLAIAREQIPPPAVPEGEEWVLPQYPVLEIAAELYREYERIRKQNNRIDYDDMTRAALRVLENQTVLEQWQRQVFAVFEDEAQDSSVQQQRLLELLARDPATGQLNFVRVGDSNQAINSTFTPADPYFFRQFCDRCRSENNFSKMTEAGRSNIAIIEAANQLHRRANEFRQWGSSIPFRIQDIHPAPIGDPQPDANPDGPGVELCFPETIQATAQQIGDRVAQLLAANPKRNAAVLVRYKSQVQFLYKQLKDRAKEAGFQLYDAGQSGRRSQVPVELLAIVQFLSRPHSPQYLRSALDTLRGRNIIPKLNYSRLASIPEQFLYPGPLAPELEPAEQSVQKLCTSLLKASLELTPPALLTFLALTLRYDANELATADKLSDRVARQVGAAASLRSAVEALTEIVADADFSPLEADADSIFTRPNQLTLMTLHKAKGLDWDYVFLPFLHERTFPGDAKPFVPQGHRFIGEFNLTDVTRAQLRAHLHKQPIPDLLSAQQQAHQLKGAEELRLLYVGMTRAKRLLWMSAALEAPFTWSNLSNVSPLPPSPLLQ
ncbi:ATP-dependent helicase [Synechococcus sp. PCC 7336]|uniref:ATP-dependent helicase n=1 Tax=Synechococcus sp. PCC 7336 TaxID=195250 RepID=UPI0003483970|nr:ATP-dependent helicase [Synechococcus sp. PCC 7336]